MDYQTLKLNCKSLKIFFVLTACFLIYSDYLSADSSQEKEQQQAESAYANGDFKESIKHYQTLIESAPKENLGDLKQKLAKAYYKDQNQEEAFQTFLDALDAAQVSKQEPFISDEEQQLYQKGLDIYFDLNGGSPHEIAAKINATYRDVYDKNPNYYLIGYLLATADANLGQFNEFFDLFYRSYIHFPDHFLAYKAKAILHIKLFERGYAGQEKEKERQYVLENLHLAGEKNPGDISLYKLIILFSIDQQKANAVVSYLNKIIGRNMIISRPDIVFYVQQAVLVNQLELAQKFIDKAAEWYQYSRVINSAQDYLNLKKKELKG